MRKQLIFLFILISGLSNAQDNNKLVIQFIDDNYGEKVGSGICVDLLYKASEYVDSINGFKDSVMEDVQIEDIMAGDIIEFDSVLYSDGHFVDKHLAIVYSVNHNGIISIAEQNVGSMEGGEMIMYRGELAPLVKDSHVKFDLIILSEIVSGKIKLYRI